MEGAVGDGAQADNSRENLKGHACGVTAPERNGPRRKGLASGEKDGIRKGFKGHQWRLAFCGFVSAKLE